LRRGGFYTEFDIIMPLMVVAVSGQELAAVIKPVPG
jgi:hypothetical protein